MSPALAAAFAVVLSLQSLLPAKSQVVFLSSNDFSTACGDDQSRCSSFLESPDLGPMNTALLQVASNRGARVELNSETHQPAVNHRSSKEMPALAGVDVGRANVISINDLLRVERPQNSPHGRGAGSDLTESSSVGSARMQFNSKTYMGVAKQESNNQMAAFIEALVDRIGGIIVDHDRFLLFVPYYSGLTSVQSFSKLLLEIRDVGHMQDGWLQLPPPEKGPVLWNMIRSDPWVCDMLLETDPRRTTCALDADDNELEPSQLTCGAENTCNIEHGNSYRTLYHIGSLPCCSTPPFCSAPTCSKQRQGKLSSCTKRSASDNLAYMQEPDAWPAYHGNGGSFELDVSKYMDLLARQPDSTDSDHGTAFDLVFDLGANTGYYTEKMTTRGFGKSYIMVEANPVTETALLERWNNTEWKHRWFSEQVAKPEQGFPNFEIVNAALSNHSKGVINMCETEASFEYAGCEAHIVSLDNLVAKKLTPTFQDIVHKAQSAFVKIDTEGMDELVLRGMQGLLNETRGEHADGRERYLVNFLQFEFSPALMKKAKEREQFHSYNIKTVTEFLESLGFESFLIGPRFLPLSHGSWGDEFLTVTSDTGNNAGVRLNYPHFDDRICHYCTTSESTTFTADIFALRTSHPRATELKLALGACKESEDFYLKDPQYSMQHKAGNTTLTQKGEGERQVE